MQEVLWRDKGLRLQRQWHIVLNTMRVWTGGKRCINNNIAVHQLRSDRLQ